jgi:hypothetical protein
MQRITYSYFRKKQAGMEICNSIGVNQNFQAVPAVR